jgi:hypothetical protein
MEYTRMERAQNQFGLALSVGSKKTDCFSLIDLKGYSQSMDLWLIGSLKKLQVNSQ